jgi:DNA-binding NarL/FixJ family response regulator
VDAVPDLTVVGEAADGAEAVALARTERPDVVLMDVRMPGMDGIEATRHISAETRVIILTTFDLDEYVYGALRAGASGFLLKDTPPAGPGDTAGGHPEGGDRAGARGTRPGRARPVQRRDRRPSVRIGGHRQDPRRRLLMKLNARDRAQLVIIAYETGLAGRRRA